MFYGLWFLKSGVTVAIFIFQEKNSFSRDRLNIYFGCLLISPKHFLATFIPPYPKLLFSFNEKKSLLFGYW